MFLASVVFVNSVFIKTEVI